MQWFHEVVELIGHLAWPVVVLCAFLKFAPSIKLFIAKLQITLPTPIGDTVLTQQPEPPQDAKGLATASAALSIAAAGPANVSNTKSDELETMRLQRDQAIATNLMLLTYTNIYGSQLQLLYDLNVRGTIGYADALPYYNDSTKKGNKQTFDQWLEYLVKWLLTSRSESITTHEQSLSITPAGRSFVNYCTSAGLLIVNRPY